MKLFLTSISAILLFSACSSSNENTLCDCVEKGAQVDALAQEILVTQEANQAKKDSLDALLEERDSICKEFIDIDPMELEKERANCEGIKIQ
ncbi:hypothetical protein SAMN05216474_1454 [Lishizhenia tianjinensis]|uniref:Lipoprotein n=1 Tax=Lishizhenia tianjinensis TaxID=477690 RepID=A0A1I6ZLE7_9FLAO|nr:hypothetical protein [Lishizhenia tianjinensis]SFT63437.1 hypothetical protein SAMN05216474_1454 [Lishizhenia tianjinensis]